LTAVVIATGCQSQSSVAQTSDSTDGQPGPIKKATATMTHATGNVAAAAGRTVRRPYDWTANLFKRQRDEDAAEADEGLPLINSNDAYKLRYTPRWSTSIAARAENDIAFATVLGDVVAIVERPQNMVSTINLRDGLVRWQVVVGDPLERIFEPVRLGDQILVNSESELHYLDAKNGRFAGNSHLESVVTDRPTIVGTDAIFGGLSGNLFAHATEQGFSRWRYRMTSGIVVRPVSSGFHVFVTDTSGVYAMFQARSGDLMWKGRTFGQNSATPVINDLGVFLASEDQTLYALNRSTGSDRWRFRASVRLRQSPVVIGNTVYLNVPDIALVAIDALSGDELWRIEGVNANPVSVHDGRLILATRDQLIVVDPQTGTSLAHALVQPLMTVLAGPDDALILVSQDGRLMRLDPLR
jgi:outer membrane protein assembly factor BamB